MSINKIFLSGNVGNDPDVKNLESGKKLAKFSLATTDKNKDKTTQWHSIIVWEKLAEIVEKYVKKGNYITVIGSISYREYEKDGVKKYFTEVNAYEIELPPKRVNETESTEDNQDQWRKGEKRQVGAMSSTDDLPGNIATDEENLSFPPDLPF